MSDRALIAAWTAMNHAALLRYPLFQDGPAAIDKLRGHVIDYVCRGRHQGELAVLRRGDEIDAVFAAWPDPGSWYGVPVHTVQIGVTAPTPAVCAWIVERLTALAARCSLTGLDLMVFAAWRPVADAILAAGLGVGVDSVILLGEPMGALDALVARHDPPPISAFGLTAGPLADEREVDALVALNQRVFTGWPAHCWFGAAPATLARERAALLTQLDGGDPDELGEVVRRDGEVVGHIGLRIDRENGYWGSLAGVGLVLDPSIWGRGLVKTLYRRGLERLVEAGAQVFKGGTSQPAVLGLARVMQRPLLAWHLRHGVPFGAAHFQGYV